MPLIRMAVMMTFSTEGPCTGDIHDQAETRDRDRLGEMDRNRREDTADRFVADQERNHREDDSAGEAREVSELASAEREARIVGMLTGVGIRERREQERTSVCAHMQAIGNKRD